MRLSGNNPNVRTLLVLGEDVITGAQRSLELLKAIEETISALCYAQKKYSAMTAFAKLEEEAIRKAQYAKPLDPEGSIEDKLLLAQNATKELHQALIEKRGLVRSPEIREEDGLEEELERTIKVVAELHDALNDLRWVVGEHDANLSSSRKGQTLKSPEEIEKFLSSL